jgi:hypothetical protein
VWAYTAQLGNGLSASISAEQRRMSQIVGTVGGVTAGGLPTFVIGGNPANASLVVGTSTIGAGYGGIQSPDIVGNIRLDQTWGSAQVMAAAHEVNANYYGPTTITNGNGLSATGHPSDRWGWAVGVGLRWNFPFIAQGDYFQMQAAYTRGAMGYLDKGNNTPNFGWERGADFGFGVQSDCVFTSSVAFVGAASPINGTGCNLTSGWQVNASYEHYWTPQFHESFFGGITELRYNSQANAILCTAEGSGVFIHGVPQTGASALAAPGCNNNFDIWSAGTRLQYDFTKTLYFGVEFLYQHLDSASLPGNVLTPTNTTALLPANNDLSCAAFNAATGRAPCGNIKDMNNLAVTARIHKDFLP